MGSDHVTLLKHTEVRWLSTFFWIEGQA
jgi:hypothetical protein